MANLQVHSFAGTAGAPGDPLMTIIVAEGDAGFALEFHAEDGDDWVWASITGPRRGTYGMARLPRANVARLIAALGELKPQGE